MMTKRESSYSSATSSSLAKRASENLGKKASQAGSQLGKMRVALSDVSNREIVPQICGKSSISKGVLGRYLSRSCFSENQLSDLHKLMVEAADILNIESPDLYVQQNPVPNAYTLSISGKKPFIVVHTSLIELLTRKELQAVLAHELGHLKCEHGVWLTFANILTLGALEKREYVPSFLPPSMVAKGKESEKKKEDEKPEEKGKGRNIDHFMEELIQEQSMRERRNQEREQLRGKSCLGESVVAKTHTRRGMQMMLMLLSCCREMQEKGTRDLIGYNFILCSCANCI